MKTVLGLMGRGGEGPRKGEKMKTVLGILLFVPCIVFSTVELVWAIQLDQNCEGYLKRAADANTVEMAKEELGKAIEYAEEKKLTEGYTSILYKTPNEDVGFWYKNLKASSDELGRVKPETPQLERTNILMKLRETLLDSNDGKTSVTVPPGISKYPYNTAWAFVLTLAVVAAIAGAILICVDNFE